MEENLQIVPINSHNGLDNPSMFDVALEFNNLKNTFEHVSFKQIIMDYENIHPSYLVVTTD